MKTMREAARTDWNTGTDAPSWDVIQVCMLQRIAEAVELMGKRHADLIEGKELAEDRARRYREDRDREIRRNAALRGVIGRLKREQRRS